MRKNVQGDAEDKMLNEYAFDYTKAKSNRFAEQLVDKQVMVVLDPDVAAVFQSSDDVNRVLRALIEAMPHPAEM
ncbi:MAG: hypothetical protein WAU00_17635 [Caldilinea sp.]|uniref:hypothetical protein n=1 Tax=Caldilinea sp. TaxID=2293560 RepID=UPI002C587AEA|nr:hypothetical protein [Caldilinea sp.]